MEIGLKAPVKEKKKIHFSLIPKERKVIRLWSRWCSGFML